MFHAVPSGTADPHQSRGGDVEASAQAKPATAQAVVEEAVGVLADGDLGGFSSALADDITWEVMGADYMPAGARYEGKQAVLDDFVIGALTLYDVPTLKVDITGSYADGANVVLEWTVTAKTSKGRDYENHYCAVFEVIDGQIRSAREYTNTLYAKQVLFD